MKKLILQSIVVLVLFSACSQEKEQLAPEEIIECKIVDIYHKEYDRNVTVSEEDAKIQNFIYDLALFKEKVEMSSKDKSLGKTIYLKEEEGHFTLNNNQYGSVTLILSKDHSKAKLIIGELGVNYSYLCNNLHTNLNH